MQEFNSIVLSGGSLKVISALGVVKYLEENNLINKVRNYVGTSAGAILCFFLVLGFNVSEIESFLLVLLQDPDITRFNVDEMFNLFRNYGMNSGRNIVLLLERILMSKLNIKDINFIDLAKITGKNLVVCVANLSKEKEEYFCLDNTPTLSVITAIRVTCSIPLLFTPTRINGDVYVDGGIYNNFPIEYLDNKDELRDVFGVNIVCKNYQKMGNFIEFMKFLIYSIIEKINRKNINDSDNNIITLEFENDGELLSTADLSVNFDKNKFKTFMKYGYDCIKSREPKESSEM